MVSVCSIYIKKDLCQPRVEVYLYSKCLDNLGSSETKTGLYRDPGTHPVQSRQAKQLSLVQVERTLEGEKRTRAEIFPMFGIW